MTFFLNLRSTWFHSIKKMSFIIWSFIEFSSNSWFWCVRIILKTKNHFRFFFIIKIFNSLYDFYYIFLFVWLLKKDLLKNIKEITLYDNFFYWFYFLVFCSFNPIFFDPLSWVILGFWFSSKTNDSTVLGKICLCIS